MVKLKFGTTCVCVWCCQYLELELNLMLLNCGMYYVFRTKFGRLMFWKKVVLSTELVR